MFIHKIINSEKDPEQKKIYKMILKLATQFHHYFRFVEIDDLFQEGILSLEDTKRKFKSTFKCPFYIFAQFDVKNYMEKFILKNYFPKIGSVFYRVSLLRNQLRNFDTTDLQKIQEKLKMSPKLIRKYMEHLSPDENFDSMELTDPDSDFINNIERELIIMEIPEAINKLTPFERFIFRVYFGIGYKKRSLSDIAKENNISRQAVYQSYRNIISKIKQELFPRDRGLSVSYFN